MSRIIILIFLVLIAGCGNDNSDNHDNYVGLWEAKSQEGSRVVRISEESDTYLLNLNPITDKDYRGEPDPGLVLQPIEKTLRYAQEKGDMVISMNDTISVNDVSYTRITEGRLEELKVIHADEIVRKESFKELCKQLKQAYKNDRKSIKEDKNNEKWSPILTPAGVPVWISAKYVEESGLTSVTVVASRVGLRTEPEQSKNFIIGIVDTNDTLEVIQKQGDWYQVSTPNNFEVMTRSAKLTEFFDQAAKRALAELKPRYVEESKSIPHCSI